MPNPSPQLITLISTEAAMARLGVGTWRFVYLARTNFPGFPKARRIGRTNYYDPAEIDAFKASGVWNRRTPASVTVPVEPSDWQPSNEEG